MLEFLMLFGLLHTSAPASEPAQARCPSATAETRSIVTAVTTTAQYASVRKAHGLSLSSLITPRALVDSLDASVCDRLNAMADAYMQEPGWRTTWIPGYFKTGTRYLVVLTKKPTPVNPAAGTWSLDLSWSPMWVLDSSLNQLGFYYV